MRDNAMQSLLYGLAALAAAGFFMVLLTGVKALCRKLLKKAEKRNDR